jgi:hypothetical protein
MVKPTKKKRINKWAGKLAKREKAMHNLDLRVV